MKSKTEIEQIQDDTLAITTHVADNKKSVKDRFVIISDKVRRKKIKFTVYGNPKGKGRPKFARVGKFVKAYTPEKTRENENSILMQAIKHRPDEPFTCPIEIFIKCFMQAPKSIPKRLSQDIENERIAVIVKPDTDNMQKSVLDALNGIFWKDDSQVFDLHGVKFYSNKPRMEVTIIPHSED